MPQKIDVELTSEQGEGTFTWRAHKARQPKGTVGSSILPAGAKVGDIVRVEVEIEMDGMRILSAVPLKAKSGLTGQRIEVKGSKAPVIGVTTVLAGPENKRREHPFFREGAERRGGGGGGGESRGRGRDGGNKVASARAPAPSEPGAAPDGQNGSRDRRPAQRRDRPAGDRPASSRPRPSSEGADRGPREGFAAREGSASGQRGRGPREGAQREAGARPSAPREGARPSGPREGARSSGPSRGERSGPPARKAPFRLEPGSKYRDELMGGLSAEQRVIADRLAAAAGSLPVLRKAIADEQERAKAENRPFDGGEQILAVAEQLLPDVKAAMWLDRAEAAAKHIEQLSLRDLRAIVIAGAPRTELGRELEKTLREGLETRVSKLRTDWEEHLTQALTEGRILAALRLSAKPPEPSARFPANLVETLANQAGAAMNAETAPDRWLALLAAAELAPVRRQIHPAGIPEDPTGEVHRKSGEAAGRIPALAAMLGMAMPPPPKPVPGERPPRPTPPRPNRGPRPGGPNRPVASAAPTAPAAVEAAEPVAEAAEPAIEATAPAAQPTAPVVQPTAPAAEPAVEAVAEPIVEVAEPVAEATETAVQPTAPVAEPAVEAVAEPLVEVAEPVAEATETAVQPTAPVAEPVAEPAVEAVAEPAVEAVGAIDESPEEPSV